MERNISTITAIKQPFRRRGLRVRYSMEQILPGISKVPFRRYR